MNISQKEIDELAKEVLKQGCLMDAMNLIVSKAYEWGKKENELVLEDIKAEIVEMWKNEPCAIEGGCLNEIIKVLDKHISGKEDNG